MLNIITTGKSFQRLQYCIQIYKAIVSVYKLRSQNTFVLGLNTTEYDSLNMILTANLFRSKKSTYMFKFFLTSYLVVWTRIIFRGKGFRIRNFQKELKLTLNFGHSHWNRIKFYKFWFFWKIKRQSYVAVSYDLSCLTNFLSILPTIKLINRYTKRGLRLKRQAIIRRFGKISQHVSSLH